MKKIISFLEKLKKSKQPSSKSYLTVKESVEDPLVTDKLQFVSFVSNIVEPYLRKYQTDKPMIPFVYFDLKDLVIKLLDIIVKPTVINNCKSGKQLKEIDLSNEENLISVGNINMGFAVEDIIKRLKQQDKVSLSQLKAFKEGVQQLVISVLEKFIGFCCPLFRKRVRSFRHVRIIERKVTRTLETSPKAPDSSRYHSSQSMRSGYGCI